MNSVLKAKGKDISEESEEEPEVLENNILARGESVNLMSDVLSQCHSTQERIKDPLLHYPIEENNLVSLGVV